MTNDSSKVERFGTGAVRDITVGKPRLELISPIFLRRLGYWLAHCTEPEGKYPKRNWEKGIPMDRTMASLLRHINAYREGATDEDHLAAAACNLMFLVHIEEMINKGALPKDLADIPNYQMEEA